MASYPATSTINAPTKGLGGLTPVPTKVGGTVSVTGTETKWNNFTDPLEVTAVRADLAARKEEFVGNERLTKSVNIGYLAPLRTQGARAAKQMPRPLETLQFTGVLDKSTLPVANTKSNATKEIYYGAFTVGTGEYREWQGKYAVLKVDLLTNNAILRVYNE